MNKKMLLGIMLLGILLLSGCTTMGTLERPITESFIERADGSIVGHARFKNTIDNIVGITTYYRREGENLVVDKEVDPTTTPTVAGQATVGAITAFAGSAPMAAGIASGQAAAASAAKSVSRIHAGVAREGIEASKHAAPSTIFNISPTAFSGSESAANIDNAMDLLIHGGGRLPGVFAK